MSHSQEIRKFWALRCPNLLVFNNQFQPNPKMVLIKWLPCPWYTYLLNPFLLYLYDVEVVSSFWSFLQTVELLGWVISSSQGLYLNTGQHKHIHIHIHIPNIHALCGIRNHNPGFRASEDNTRPRPLGYRDRPVIYKQNKKKTPWLGSASGLYRPSDRRLSAKLVPTLADRGCRVVSATNPPQSLILVF
jgi:hypothetical protein